MGFPASSTHWPAEYREDPTAIVVRTRKSRITIPLDIEWELTRQRNLAANNIRIRVDTRSNREIR